MIVKPTKKPSTKGHTFTLHTTMEKVVHDKKGHFVNDVDNFCHNCLGTGKTHKQFMSWSQTEYKSLKELKEAESLKFYGFNTPKVKRKKN